MIEHKPVAISGNQFIFREMERGDLDQVNEIEKEAFPSPWPLEALAFELEENPFCNSFVMELEGRVAGYAFLWIIDEDSHLVNIAVSRSLRGRRAGTLFMRHLIGFAKQNGAGKMRLEVREGNAAAVNLYLSFHFEISRKQKNYYSNGEDALMMVLSFEAGNEP
jgi:[ribosomal protein S18]-alanine N-acetyltransferase